MKEMVTIEILKEEREAIMESAIALKGGEWLTSISHLLDYSSETDMGNWALRDSVRYYAEAVAFADMVIKALSAESSD